MVSHSPANLRGACGEPAISHDSYHVSLHCLATLVTPTWLIINRASSPTVARPSCRQCDSPTSSHTAFLSRFHARCRSPFWLHNRQSRLLGGEPCGEPAISHDSHHVSLVQWTTCLLPVSRDPGSNPLGGLMWNRDSPVSIVSLHACSIPTRNKNVQHISEWTLMSISRLFREFSVRHIFSDIGCRCRMLDIADVEIDVDANLCCI